MPMMELLEWVGIGLTFFIFAAVAVVVLGRLQFARCEGMLMEIVHKKGARGVMVLKRAAGSEENRFTVQYLDQGGIEHQSRVTVHLPRLKQPFTEDLFTFDPPIIVKLESHEA